MLHSRVLDGSGATKYVSMLGHPVSGALSPRIYAYLLAKQGIDGAAIALQVRPEDLAAAMRLLPRIGWVGLSITAPHKQAALAIVDDIDADVRRMGAINCVEVRPDGKLIGHNTDAFGFIEGLKAGLPGFDFGAAPAVVLGAGGAARACVPALLDAGVRELRLINRSTSRAEALAKDIGGPIRVTAWADRHRALSDAGLLVNTTTQGMEPNPPLDIDLRHLPPTAAVNDIVRTPVDTPLLKAARARGLRAVDGVGMVLHQVRPACRYWYGFEPEITEGLREIALGRRA